MSLLFDASCGKGELVSCFAEPIREPRAIPCGYAGGISPASISKVLGGAAAAAKGTSIWIDMESGIRQVIVNKEADGSEMKKDVFSIDKCFACVQEGVKFGLPVSRFTLLSI